MMKTKFHPLAPAVAMLLGVAGLSACSSDEVAVDNDNPTFDGRSVKTQFAISLPKSVAKGGRQIADIVQEDGAVSEFRGMESIYLLPFALGSSESVGNNSAPSGSIVALEAIGAYSGSSNPFDQTTANVKVYSNVQINTGVNHLVIYGRAWNGTTSGSTLSSASDKFSYGILTPSAIASASALQYVTFALKPVIDQATSSTKETALLGLMGTVDNIITTKCQEAQLLAVRDQMRTNRAASSAAVLEVMKRVYKEFVDAEGDTEAVKAEKKAVRDALVATSGTQSEYARLTVSNDAVTALPTDCQGYPADLNLPEGAVQMTCTVTEAKATYSAAHKYITGEQKRGNIAPLDKYVFPASLYYTASSALRVADEIKSDEFADKQWNAIVGGDTPLYQASETTVKSTTRSIAVVDPINYAVGRLDVTAKFSAANNVKDAADVDVAVNHDFALTAVLVGGQKAVSWDFAPQTDAAEKTLYDCTMNNAPKVNGTTASGANYTLVLPTTADTPVYVALELTNASESDFQGADGIVPAGGKFYLVGKLDPKAESGVTQPNQQTTINQVFLKDHHTIANFTIKDLKKAYNVIPDLTAPKIELAMSVDLTWQKGLTFDVDLGGGEVTP